MRVSLTQKQIYYNIRQCKKGSSTSHIVAEMKISQRRVQQLWAMYRATGNIPTLQMPGRPKIPPTEEQINAVLAAHHEMPAGVTRTTKYLNHKDMQISEKMVYTIMESVLLFEVGRSVGYICKKQSFVWGNMHYLAKYSVPN